MPQGWQLAAFGVEHLALRDLESEPLGRTSVRVRVRAVSLNYRDLMMVRGQYDPRQPLPLVPCSDLAGEVIEIGPDVTRFVIGDRVIAQFAQRWTSGMPDPTKLRSTLGGPLQGTLCEERVLDQEGLYLAPAHLSFVEAATLPCAALTAWHALVDHGQLKAGQYVLLQGTGGVSMFGLQIAKLFGAQTIATSSKPEKRQRLLELGATHVLDYREPGLSKAVRKLARNGVDHVVEVGGAGTLQESLRAVCSGGAVHVIGVLSGSTEPLNILPILMNEVRLFGAMVGPRESAEEMCRAFASARLIPIVDRVFPFGSALDAFNYFAAQEHFGKVVIEM